jgi:hypothetical protein
VLSYRKFFLQSRAFKMMNSKLVPSVVAVLGLLEAAYAFPSNQQAPTITVKNGSYYGTYSESFDQEYFLGMPFAQPPLGDLRFRNPVPLNTSWTGSRNATSYGKWCYGQFNDEQYDPSEDCLTINVVRPAGYEGQPLPVAAWIYGGGFFAVGSNRRCYGQYADHMHRVALPIRSTT